MLFWSWTGSKSILSTFLIRCPNQEMRKKLCLWFKASLMRWSKLLFKNNHLLLFSRPNASAQQQVKSNITFWYFIYIFLIILGLYYLRDTYSCWHYRNDFDMRPTMIFYRCLILQTTTIRKTTHANLYFAALCSDVSLSPRSSPSPGGESV